MHCADARVCEDISPGSTVVDEHVSTRQRGQGAGLARVGDGGTAADQDLRHVVVRAGQREEDRRGGEW